MNRNSSKIKAPALCSSLVRAVVAVLYHRYCSPTSIAVAASLPSSSASPQPGAAPGQPG